MKKVFIITLTTLFSLGIFAQETDVKAKGILDKLSAQTKAYKTIKAEFQFTINNKTEGINESQTGKIQIKGDKYFLSIAGQDVISDGKNIYTILKDAEEVQINSIPDEDEDDFISPNSIFTLYEDGFKYKYVKEDKGIHIINLYPKAAEEKEFHRIALYINKAKNQISKIKIFGKDGSTTIYTIKSFVANAAIPDSKFSFNKTTYPKFEIVDLRD
ncbi:MAG: outer membrane lipoprotein carrier protein LolA [Flavobacteriales bacterium]|nr:outer membrane lipoprotein carrier protein LolA [Flavobacteriales bacterium]